MLNYRTILASSAALLMAAAAQAQAVPGQGKVSPMDIDARMLAHITSGQRLNSQVRRSTLAGRYVPGQNNVPMGNKRLASDMTQPNAMQAQSGAKIARLRSYVGPQGNEGRVPNEVCNADVNIGTIMPNDTAIITGPVRQEVYTGDITVVNLNRCRSMARDKR